MNVPLSKVKPQRGAEGIMEGDTHHGNLLLLQEKPSDPPGEVCATG